MQRIEPSVEPMYGVQLVPLGIERPASFGEAEMYKLIDAYKALGWFSKYGRTSIAYSCGDDEPRMFAMLWKCEDDFDRQELASVA